MLVIPGRREAASPQSIKQRPRAMDSGFATFGGAPEWPSRANAGFMESLYWSLASAALKGSARP
jgi:hypothetical protein